MRRPAGRSWRASGAPLVLVAASLAWGCSPPPPVTEPEPGPEVRRIEASPGLVIRRACTPTGPELCFNARDDNCNAIIDEGCGVETGLVQFAIAWDAAGADVDLHVTDPEGELADVGRTTSTGLTKHRDCPGRHNECQGQNMENVYLEKGEPERGVYRVAVRLEKLGGENPPIEVVLGARVGPKTYQLEVVLAAPEDEKQLLIEL